MKKFCILLAVILCMCTSAVFATDFLDMAPLDVYPQDFPENEGELEILSPKTNENIIMADTDVNVSGQANDLIILAGNNINSNASGLYSFIAGNTVNLSNVIEKDIFIAGKSISIDGNVGRDAFLAGSDISINSNIGRNVQVFASTFRIGNNAVINGDINVFATNISIADGAVINGTVTYYDTATTNIPSYVKTNIIKDTRADNDELKTNPSLTSKIQDRIFWSIANFVLFALTLLIAPGLFKKVSDANRSGSVETYLKSLGFGFLLLFFVPLLAIILMITLIGMPFGFISLLLYVLLIIYSTVFVGYLIGDTIFKDKMNNYLKGLIGIIIIEVLKIIPVIGGIVSFATVLISLGLLVVALLKKSVKVNEIKVEE